MSFLSEKFWFSLLVGALVLQFLLLGLSHQITQESGKDFGKPLENPLPETKRQLVMPSDDRAKNIGKPQEEMTSKVQFGDSDARREALIQQCTQLAHEDPLRAVTLARNYGLDARPGAVIEGIVQTWAEKDVSAACSWTQGLPVSALQDECYKRITFVWAQGRPEEAAQFVIRKMPPGDAQTESAMTVIHQWALHDMAAASAWVRLFPEGDLRTRALHELQGVANAR